MTRIDVDECRRRLEHSTTRFLGLPVGRGWLSANEFTLHRVTFFNNSFKPFAYVSFDESPTADTNVHVRLSGAVSVQVVFGILYAFLVLFGALALLAALTRAPSSGNSGEFGVVVPILVFGPFALTLFGRTIALAHRDYLIRFLVEELELREAPPEPFA